MQPWIDKFRCAGRGLRTGMYRQSSFAAHFTIAISVFCFAIALRCEFWQWCVLALCIGFVLAFEYMNSAVERLAKGLCSEENADVGAALDISSAAVLVASIVASLIGGAIFASKLWQGL